jgi:hypothetical protein
VIWSPGACWVRQSSARPQRQATLQAATAPDGASRVITGYTVELFYP